MSSTCSWALLPGALFCALSSCSSDPEGALALPPSEGSIAFATSSIELTPREAYNIPLLTSSNVETVSLSLTGEYGDSSLETAKLTPVNGRSWAGLHAASAAANFYLSATAARSTSTRLYVAVSATGFAEVRVVPDYKGKRATSLIVASAFLKATCAELAAIPLADGAPVARGSAGDDLLLKSIPAGVHVAVAVRIEHYASGCVDVDALAPSTRQNTSVTVYDRPVDLSKTDLTTTFSFNPTQADAVAWSNAYAAAATKAVDAIAPTQASEAIKLLDAMAVETPSLADKALFQSARLNAGWDAPLAVWLSSHGGLRARASTWLSMGSKLTQSPLALRLVSAAGPEQATATAQTLGPIAAGEAGFTAQAPFVWVADADDVLRIQGTLTFPPTQLATAAASVEASGMVAGATDGATALATTIDCAGIAQNMASGHPSYGNCDATCTAGLCRAALATLWKKARNRSAELSEETSLTLSSTGHASLTDDAEPIAFSGDWLGTVKTPEATFGSKGGVSAARTSK